MFFIRLRTFFILPAVLVVVGFAGSAGAQTEGASNVISTRTEPPAAAPVATGSHDADGLLVVRAMRLPERLLMDGRLDESAYLQVLPVSGFVQAEPRFDEPATEQTQLWVFFDDDAIYVGIRCFDSDISRWSSLDMRRDSLSFSQGESVSVAFDTFHDKRNGFIFGANPAGGMMDSAVTNERDSNRDWNTLVDTRTATFDGGWSVEFAIPFKSLRYRPGEQVWGVNVRRIVKWKNEISYLTQVPQGQQAQGGLFRFSSAATLVGVSSPPESRLFEIKPYGISSLKTDRTLDEPISNEATGNIGIDAKVGVTQGLVADFTYNTDFAQVEDDEQQINLSRFSLFFPEKREFFLEGQGIFAFGGYAQRRMGNPGEIPLPFFSRRIGIDDDGHAVPILGGGRLTGRIGRYSLGIVNIQTKQDDLSGEPATNFSVIRVRRDIMRRSNVGLIVVNRSAYGNKLRANQTYGIDGVFSFFENLNVNTFVARTSTPELRGDADSYRAQLDYNADRYGIVLERMIVGENFNPEAGYVRRRNFRRSLADLRFSPRPRSSRVIRRYDYSISVDQFVRGTDGVLETRQMDAVFGMEFQNSDRLSVQLLDNREQLIESFEVFGNVEVPAGKYHFRNFHSEYQLGTQHKVSGGVGYDRGGFFGGTKQTVAYAGGRVEPVSNLFIEPGASINWVDLPQGKFVASVINSRVIYTFTPRTFIGAFVQFNSNNHSLSINARLRWEYRPGSDLFVVYSDSRNTLTSGFPGLETRALTVKITRFFRT
jgi:hypothetical protein